MVRSKEKQGPRFAIKLFGGLLVTLFGLMLLTLAGPIAVAQTKDNPDDLTKALSNQKYFVAPSVKANSTFMGKNQDIEQQLNNTVNKLKGKQDTRIAVISNAIIPSQFSQNTESYGEFLYGFLNPRPDVLVLVNAETSVVALNSDKLTPAERQEIINESRSTFVSKNVTAGTVLVAEKAADKISAKESSGVLTTIAIVVVVLLVIGGAVAYLMITTKKNWNQKVAGVENLANQVSDQVLRVSDEVNFLPDATRAQTDVEFGAATQNFSEANSRLRELQKVSPVTLLLKGPDYQRKLDLTGAQFEQARQALSQVEQRVRSLPGS